MDTMLFNKIITKMENLGDIGNFMSKEQELILFNTFLGMVGKNSYIGMTLEGIDNYVKRNLVDDAGYNPIQELENLENRLQKIQQEEILPVKAKNGTLINLCNKLEAEKNELEENAKTIKLRLIDVYQEINRQGELIQQLTRKLSNF
jgi:hypothetical protein